jgi:hypothetical protein
MEPMLEPTSHEPLWQHWQGVLDPALLESRYSLHLTRRLGHVLKLWSAREFSTPPMPAPDPATPRPFLVDERHVQQLSFKLEREFKRCYSCLVNALNDRVEDREPHALAVRDSLALTALLPSSFLLSTPSETGEHHASSALFEAWGIPSRRIAAEDPYREHHRDTLRELISAAGLSPQMWAGMRLAVVQLDLPGFISSVGTEGRLTIEGVCQGLLCDTGGADFWEGARAYWYEV